MEQIVIGENITITICRVERGRVLVGIDAPREIPIKRIEKPPKPQTTEE